MSNFDDRSGFWSTHYKKKYQGGAPFNLLLDNIHLFIYKDVLEIGPGEGRQFEKVKDVCMTYSVADISEIVLSQDMYKNLKKYLITSYDMDIKEKFDVVHFWYVVNHILPEELYIFFKYICGLVKESGVVMFNYQDTKLIKKYTNDALENNGKKTTNISIDKIEGAIKKFFYIEKHLNESKYRSVICRKKERTN